MTSVFLRNNPYPFNPVMKDNHSVLENNEGDPILFGDFSNGFFGEKGWIKGSARWADIGVMRKNDKQMFFVGDEVLDQWVYDGEIVNSKRVIKKFWFFSEENSLDFSPAVIAEMIDGGDVNIENLIKSE